MSLSNGHMAHWSAASKKHILCFLFLVTGSHSLIFTGTSLSASTDQSAIVAFCGLDKTVNVYGRLFFLGDSVGVISYDGTTEILRWNEKLKCFSVMYAALYTDCPLAGSALFRGCRSAVVYATPHDRVKPVSEKGLLLCISDPRISDTGTYYIRVSLAGRNVSDIFRIDVVVTSSSIHTCGHADKGIQECIRYADRVSFENYLIGHVGQLLPVDSELHAVYNVTPRSVVGTNTDTMSAFTNSTTKSASTNLIAMKTTHPPSTRRCNLRRALPKLIYMSSLAGLCLLVLLIGRAVVKCKTPKPKIYKGDSTSDGISLINSAVNDAFGCNPAKEVDPSNISEGEKLENMQKTTGNVEK
ncbi:glycoprotein I [Gallid alphaherpesvirus 3]|uniref:Envelope glycoprotein I n=4 Tax=Alphaherpesvirinae TaxID=10293 RepID=Q782M5_9ALPH|nr:envelope glycoprotein I [Gallid alphaherpesvirus 3]YP_010795692.1 glycoprotein I [Gallid alphaherpesvirus 3]BAA12814.1 glycoprotein homolog I [Gallid alphaherpesvirus 1]BAA32012.1 glycoprotein I [Marek's disease virus serotype 2 MDV2]AEI00301.1 glycoprotein I [Gallid alphaherpesvirus 3]QEY02250.1 glycoprotein I [Gallid alphaherpesvirus 3]BAB16591.1 glycoprotein I [Gallid alphaherpesvirus 3]